MHVRRPAAARHPVKCERMTVLDSFRLDGKVAVVTGGNRGREIGLFLPCC